MGQFLAIGLVERLFVEKKNLEKFAIYKDRLVDAMVKQLYFEPGVYDEKDDDEHVYFDLKPDILYNELIPFL